MSIKPHRGSQRWWTDEEIFESLHRLAKRLGRTPTYKEINNRNGCPAESALRMRFGSTRAALERAGLNPGESAAVRTKRRAEAICALRAEGKTYKQIAAALGLSVYNAWRIGRAGGAASQRGPQKAKPPLIPPPIDPEKARRITEMKRRYWEKAS